MICRRSNSGNCLMGCTQSARTSPIAIQLHALDSELTRTERDVPALMGLVAVHAKAAYPLAFLVVRLICAENSGDRSSGSVRLERDDHPRARDQELVRREHDDE